MIPAKTMPYLRVYHFDGRRNLNCFPAKKRFPASFEMTQGWTITVFLDEKEKGVTEVTP